MEKRWYTNASPRARAIAERVYKMLFATGLLVTGRTYRRYREAYLSQRGMEYDTDVRDWLGGYPYESASPTEVSARLVGMGFALRRQQVRRHLGLFGTGCDEYVFFKI